jgi:hypothetical protein
MAKSQTVLVQIRHRDHVVGFTYNVTKETFNLWEKLDGQVVDTEDFGDTTEEKFLAYFREEFCSMKMEATEE